MRRGRCKTVRRGCLLNKTGCLSGAEGCENLSGKIEQFYAASKEQWHRSLIYRSKQGVFHNIKMTQDLFARIFLDLFGIKRKSLCYSSLSHAFKLLEKAAIPDSYFYLHSSRTSSST